MKTFGGIQYQLLYTAEILKSGKKQMLRVILNDRRKVTYETLQIPEPIESEALIDVRSVAICFSDLLPYQGKYLDLLPLPMVQGHEFGGIIEKISDSNKEFSVGMKVAVYPFLSCGKCRYCMHNMDLFCENQIMFGSPQKNGAMTEKIAVPVKNLVKLDDDFNILYAPLIEPTAVAYRVAGQIVDSNVILFGASADGLLIQQILKFNNNKIITLDNSKERLEAARTLGADMVLDLTEKNVVRSCIEFFKSDMIDEIIITSLSQENFDMSLQLIKKNGSINYIAMPQTINIDFSKILFKAINIKGIISYSLNQFKIAANYVQKGVINNQKMISKKFSLNKAAEAFEYYDNNENVIKVLLEN